VGEESRPVHSVDQYGIGRLWVQCPIFDTVQYSILLTLTYIVDDDGKERTSILDSTDDINSIILKTLDTHISSINVINIFFSTHARHTIQYNPGSASG
jgi:hypothetical protein